MYIYENYQDLFVYPGTTLEWLYQIQPSIPATSATFIVDTIPDSPFTVTCTSGYVGTTPYAQFQVTISSTETATWAPGPYNWRMLVAFSDGSTQVLVGGIILVKVLVPLE